MKTKIIFQISSCILALLVLSNSYAQKVAVNTSFYNSGLRINTMDVSSLEKIVGNQKVISRVLKYVSKNYKSNSDIKWEQADENLIATFKSGEITTEYFFNKNGRIVYTIDFYLPEALPGYIKKMMMHSYREYVITSAAKILEANRQVWVVKLEGKKDFATIRIENGEMEQVENFQKQN